jgi:hypothetical protein
LRTRLTPAVIALAALSVGTDGIMAQQTAVTTYGERNAAAPKELGEFAFLVGKWNGVANVRLEDGRDAEFQWIWIGRYVLDGMAIADELHVAGSDGSEYLGITLRQFDAAKRSWIIEFLNVSANFVRRQVNPRTGSVEREEGAIVVESRSEQAISREFYRVSGDDRFDYSIDLSSDGGQTWNRGSIQMTMTRVE